MGHPAAASALEYRAMTGSDAHRGDAADTDVLTHLRALSDDWSETFRLLGDPTRLRLLTLLHHEEPGTLSMSELAERAGVKTATASAALRLLTTAGIVTATRDGRMMRYALADERVHRLLHHFGGAHPHVHDDRHHHIGDHDFSDLSTSGDRDPGVPPS